MGVPDVSCVCRNPHPFYLTDQKNNGSSVEYERKNENVRANWTVLHQKCSPATPEGYTANFGNLLQSSGSLAILAAMRRTSSQILRVLSSFPSLFRLQRWTELNHSSAGGRRGSGGLAMYGVMRVLIARWLAVIAMLGLLAPVMATSSAPCVPYGLWHTLQMNCR